jgi:hypothetical protein
MPDQTKGYIMEIIISAKEVYGERKYYPVCAAAKLFAEIAGTKTLTRPVLAKIKELGYTVTFKAVEEVV